MAYCRNCGVQLPEGAEFCPNCGHPVHGTAAAAAAAAAAAGPTPSDYPARLDIDYPDRPLNRVSTFFRIFAVIPIAIIVSLVGSSSFVVVTHGTVYSFSTGGLIVAPTVLMLLFRQKYPGWWFDFNLELTRFSTRVSAYLALVDDRYPSTDEEQAVHLDLERPDAKALNRWLPLVKWLLAIPHVIVLAFLGVAAFFVLVFVWFAILFTGRYPRGAFDFVVGVMRWGLRVQAYAVLLITDRYPPFSLSP